MASSITDSRSTSKVDHIDIAPLPIPAKARLTRELSLLSKSPPPGIACYPRSETNLTRLDATISGPPSSPFSKGIFLVSIQIPRRYPFEPPHVRFVTPIYHPNIDSAGRICLDTLKSQPSGSWSPAVSLPSLLLTLRTLIGEPNAEDGLVPDITNLYRTNYREWFRIAEKKTALEATDEKLCALQGKLTCQVESKNGKTDIDGEKNKERNNATDKRAIPYESTLRSQDVKNDRDVKPRLS